MSRHEGRPDWKQGKDVLWGHSNLSGDPGYLEFLDKGMTYSALTTEMELEGEPTEVVVRIPRSHVDDRQPERARRELNLLEWLWEHRDELPFQIPRSLGVAEADHGLAVVQTRCFGGSLANETVQTLVESPCDVWASAAAGTHELPPAPVRDMLGGPETRREHVVDEVLPLLERDDSTEFKRARDWLSDHLPPDDPARLLHGNLLGHSLLVTIDPKAPESFHELSVLDWEDARLGDPAYDLALVTRGRREAYKGTGDGFDELVEAYCRRAKRPVDPIHVRLWELHLKARWYLEALEERGEIDAHVQHKFNAFCNQLERCERATGESSG